MVRLALLGLCGRRSQLAGMDSATARTLVCSQLVDAAYDIAGGVRLFVENRPAVSPGDLFDVIRGGTPDLARLCQHTNEFPLPPGRGNSSFPVPGRFYF